MIAVLDSFAPHPERLSGAAFVWDWHATDFSIKETVKLIEFLAARQGCVCRTEVTAGGGVLAMREREMRWWPTLGQALVWVLEEAPVIPARANLRSASEPAVLTRKP
ncbi:MAG: hypothetical protein AB1705_03850 [Verrucomicrobiota bacterium]